MHLSDTSSIAPHLKTFMPNNRITEYFSKNTIISENQNNKQKIQILEALHIINIQPKLNRINFETNANALKSL